MRTNNQPGKKTYIDKNGDDFPLIGYPEGLHNKMVSRKQGEDWMKDPKHIKTYGLEQLELLY